MKVKIKIEQLDNGISIKWQDTEGISENKVAYEHDQEKAIGKIVMDDRMGEPIKVKL